MSVKRNLLSVALAAAVLSLSGAALAADPAKKEIVFGATAGPYSDQIKLGIKPILEKQGYTVRIVEFNDYVQPNFALAQGALDANAFQHIVYLQNFAAKNKLELSELVKVPTAPIAIYSRKYKSVDAAPEGVSVAVPNDPTNQARALVVLQELGWIDRHANHRHSHTRPAGRPADTGRLFLAGSRRPAASGRGQSLQQRRFPRRRPELPGHRPLNALAGVHRGHFPHFRQRDAPRHVSGAAPARLEAPVRSADANAPQGACAKIGRKVNC